MILSILAPRSACMSRRPAFKPHLLHYCRKQNFQIKKQEAKLLQPLEANLMYIMFYQLTSFMISFPQWLFQMVIWVHC